MMLSPPNKRKRLLTSSARLPLLTTPVNEEDELEMTDAAALTDLLKEAKRVLEVLREVRTLFVVYAIPKFAALRSSTSLLLENN